MVVVPHDPDECNETSRISAAVDSKIVGVVEVHPYPRGRLNWMSNWWVDLSVATVAVASGGSMRLCIAEPPRFICIDEFDNVLKDA